MPTENMSEEKFELMLVDQCEKEEADPKEERRNLRGLTKKIAKKFMGYMEQAKELLKDDSKIEPILLKADQKIRMIPKLGSKLAYIPDMTLMIRSYMLGEYRDISFAKLTAIVAALLYFVSPLDVIPDFIPVAGIMDDALVASVVVGFCNADIKKYMDWLKNKND